MSTSPVLLLHGLATSARRTWVETGWVDLLRDAGREVIALDLPGHGGAPLLDDWDRLEDVVAAQLPDGPLDAVGFSMGARVLLVLATREPHRFGHLVLAGVGANLFRGDETTSLPEQIGRHFEGLARSSGTDPSAVTALLGRQQPPLSDEALRAISADTLVVMGTDDFAGPAGPLVGRLTTVRLVELRGVDHFATPKSMAFLNAGLTHLGAG
jgi:hypothetical protein